MPKALAFAVEPVTTMLPAPLETISACEFAAPVVP
jgi:hypothetical protein